MNRRVGLLSSLLLILLTLSACGSWNTKDDAKLPDGSVIAFRRSHDVNAVGQDVSSTVIAHCVPGLPCQMVDYNSGYQRGIGGAVFQGTGPAAALALGNWAAASSLRPPQYNSSTVMSNGSGSTFQGGAGGNGGIGQGGRGVGGATTFQPGAVQGGNGFASANNGGVKINNTNEQAQMQAQQQRQGQTSNNWNQNTATASPTFYPMQGGDQHPSYQMNGHTFNWVPGQNVDP